MGSGGLHGTNLWTELGWRTEAVSEVLRYKKLPDMAKMTERKPQRLSVSTDAPVSSPLNTVALAATKVHSMYAYVQCVCVCVCVCVCAVCVRACVL